MNLVKLRQLRDQAQEKLNEAQSNFDAFNTVVTYLETNGLETKSGPKPAGIKKAKQKRGLATVIVQEVSKRKRPVNLKQVTELAKRAHNQNVSQSSVSGTLTLLTRKGELTRQGKYGSFTYTTNSK